MSFALRQPDSPCPSVLAEALADDVNLAVWSRQLPADVAAFVTHVAQSGRALGESRVLTLQEHQVPALDELAHGLRDIPGHAGFVADIAWLAHAYGCLTGATRVGLRLRTLRTAMCPRYHVDWVSLRLICTYAGAGSQWLEEGAMPRQALGDPGAEPLRPPRQLQAGHVALFKGERWEGNQGRGIIHRSPPVTADQPRLIMTLDWIT